MATGSKGKKRSKNGESMKKNVKLNVFEDFGGYQIYMQKKVSDCDKLGSKIITPKRELARLVYRYGRQIEGKNLIGKLRSFVIARDGSHKPKGGDDVFKWVLNLVNAPSDKVGNSDAIRKIRREANFAHKHDIPPAYYLMFSALFRDGKNMSVHDESHLKFLKTTFVKIYP